jgi:hypothetical protein
MGQEKTCKIEIEICSEAIFTSGEKERNLVQSRAQTDAHGFVYFHAKTLKGQLKRQAFWLLKQYVSMDPLGEKNLAGCFYESIVKLFGINHEEIKNIDKNYGIRYSGKWKGAGLMNLSNLELDDKIRNYFIAHQKADESDGYHRISSHDLIEAQTHIRTGIQLENGVTKNRMFNTFHTVRKGLLFYSTISFEEDLNTILNSLIDDLARIIYSFRRIGAGIHRGRGEIKARLFIGEEEIPYGEFMEIGGEKSVSLSNY